MPTVLVGIQEVVGPLPREQVHNQLPQGIVVHESEEFENNECIAWRRNTVGSLCKHSDLIDDSVLAGLNAELIH